MNSKIIAIHADCGPGIGLGHAARCCALAVALTRQGCVPILIDAAGALCAGLQPVANTAPPDADAIVAAARRSGAGVLILDSYRLGHRAVAEQAGPLRVVWFNDDARDVPDCDAVINGSPAASVLPYALPAHTLELLGPRYQIVRPGIAHRHRDGAVSRLLMTYGGADPKGVGPILAAAANDVAAAGIAVDFVVGPFADIPPNLDPAIDLHHAPDDFIALLDRADAALCAGGQTLFELAAAGIPAAAIGIGRDQEPNLTALTQAGAVLFAGWVDDPDFQETLRAALHALVADPDLRRSLARSAHGLTDGGGARRIALALQAML